LGTIVDRARFQKYLNIIRVKEFRPNLQDLFHSYNKHGRDNEKEKGRIVDKIVSETFDIMEIDDYQVGGERPITLTPDEHRLNHTAIPAHLILLKATGKYIILIEDKLENMKTSMLKLFDELRTYAFKEQKSAAYYGIATNLDKWRFCCYIPHKGIITEDNFLVSEEMPAVFTLNEDKTPSEFGISLVEPILQIIRGLLTRKDLDAILKPCFDDINRLEEILETRAPIVQSKQAE